MKRAVSISLGSSKRDKAVEVDLLGERVRIERIGTNGDMDAIVIAGGIPQPGDTLYPYTEGKPKALIEIAGQPMIQWVLDAISAARTIERVTIVGLDSVVGMNCSKQLVHVPNQGGMLNNIRTGVREVIRINPEAEFALLLSSDIPAITGEMIDWSVNTSLETQHDLYYSIVSQEIMEARYPGSRRSYVRLKDMAVCGGDMNMLRTSIVTGRDDLWNRLIDARKNAFKQAALIGYDTLLLLLLRRLTVERMVNTVAKRLDIQGRALICPYAEIAMDVDKPHQFEILRADLERRTSK